jgi:predicted DNA-binding transcriptional regulator YafY
MTAPKTVRWLDLIAFLLYHRFPVTREQIFESVAAYKEGWEEAADERTRETLRRKFERDKDELRSLGIEIETVTLADTAADEAGLGYRLRPADVYLPYLELTRGDPPTQPYGGLRHVRVSDADIALLDRATRYVAQLTESALSRAARSARRKLEFDLPIPLHTIERLLARPDPRGTPACRGVVHHGALPLLRHRSRRRGRARDRALRPLL